MKRPAAPSSASQGSGSGPARRDVDVRDWLGSIRLSGFAVIMLGLVVLGAFVLVPTVSGYIDMRQQIAAAEDAVQVTRDEIAELEREQERWQDPAYITSQARERLYYFNPGEVVYLIDDDIARDELEAEPALISAEVSERGSDWMGVILRSVARAGTAVPATGPADDGVFQPTPTPGETDSPGAE